MAATGDLLLCDRKGYGEREGMGPLGARNNSTTVFSLSGWGQKEVHANESLNKGQVGLKSWQ